MALNLVDVLITQCGLPEQFVRPRLLMLIEQRGIDPDQVSLDQVRDILSDLLLDMINETVAVPS